MVANDPSAALNAVICGVIVIVLMFYRRGDATHRPLISLLAYASVPFRFVFGLYESSHWLVVMVNILICAAVLWARGNVARLVDALRH
ncbi:TPA: phage holin family protein [Salmonella enterica]|nr:phage holin family protein [Salmonella enterica]HAK2295103.1 phage holin family protein [Salmonella enterica]HAK8254108.1 phage holin family protein [Salmonella enterica]